MPHPALRTVASSQKTTGVASFVKPMPRRALLFTVVPTLLVAANVSQSKSAEFLAPPQLGECADCIGESEGTLNACPLGADSCVSMYNDDEQHFVPPWAYDGTQAAAVQQLIQVVTRQRPLTIPVDAAPPPRGLLIDQHTTADGSIYLRMVLEAEDPGSTSVLDAAVTASQAVAAGPAGSSSNPGPVSWVSDSSNQQPTSSTSDASSSTQRAGSTQMAGGDLIDAEFVFPAGDAIVGVRGASRGVPSLRDARLRLSFASGVVLDRNVARAQMEALRKALRWEQAPVISDFDPKFNNDKPLWFEPFLSPMRPS